MTFAFAHNAFRHEHKLPSAKRREAWVAGIACGKPTHDIRTAGNNAFAKPAMHHRPLSLPIAVQSGGQPCHPGGILQKLKHENPVFAPAYARGE
jgi:hypothetical protein